MCEQMKKRIVGTLACLFVLTACGQGQSTSSSSTEKTDSLQSTLPVLENAANNTVVTKTLVFPKTAEGSQQTQTITYKGKEFLNLKIQQKRLLTDELKDYVQKNGLKEAQKALKEAEDKDPAIQEARAIAGFTVETTVLDEQEIETTTTYDFQVMDVKKAAQVDYLKSVGIENLLQNDPAQYIADRLANGAVEQ